MQRLAIAIVLVAGCNGTNKPAATTPGNGSGSGPALYAKKLAVSWGIARHDASSEDVFLQTTDDTGHQTSYPLGTYDGVCRVIKPAPAMKAATAVACTAGATGTELDAVIEDGQIVVLKAATQKGTAPDPMAREEVTRVKAPPGAAIVVGA